MQVFTMSGRTKVRKIIKQPIISTFVSQFIKGSIVERWNRTLKSRLERYFTENRTKDWYSVLQDMTRNINDTVNRTIGMAPSKVNSKNAQQIRERLYGQTDEVEPCKLAEGDRVRIPRIKNIHSKMK